MDRFEIKLNEINEILSKNQLGLIYDFIMIEIMVSYCRFLVNTWTLFKN
ncbi:Uncharacterised protein [Escherichia coli]|nr:Uncharacterised protein [Escherichia coli]